jgi:hypothetical protein
MLAEQGEPGNNQPPANHAERSEFPAMPGHHSSPLSSWLGGTLAGEGSGGFFTVKVS